MNFLKKNWQYLIYLIVTIFLFREFIFSNGVLYSSDQLENGILFRQLYADFVREFWELPLWDRFISGGIPFVDATHGDTFYPTSILKFFIPLHRALGYKLVIHVFLSGAFMYLFLKNFDLKKYASFIGGLGYMLTPMVVSLVFPGHDAKMYVAALIPLAFNFLHKSLSTGKIKEFIFLGIVVGLMVLSSHVQATYFALWLIFFYTVYYLIIDYKKDKDVKKISRKFALFWMGMFLGIIIGAVQLLPPYLYAKDFSIRGTEAKTTFEHAISWGVHPEEAFSLVVPEFSGNNVSLTNRNSYWGRNPFKLNTEYPGIIILSLTFMAMFFYKGKRKKEIYFFFGTGVFFILYALVDHTPLFYLAYKIIPGVNLFRGQGMILFLLSFVLSIIAAMFIDNFINRFGTNNDSGKNINKDLIKENKFSRNFLLTTIVFFIILIIEASMMDASMSIYEFVFSPPNMPDPSYLPTIRNGIILAGLFSFLASITLFLFLSKKINVIALTTILSLLILIDTTRINKDFIRVDNISVHGTKFKEDRLIQEIKKQYKSDGIFRIFNLGLYGLNELGIHKIETVRGFHDNELKWYRKFRGINSAGVNTDANLTYNLRQGHENSFLNIVGARYILTKSKDGKPNIIPNKNFMPRAFIVSDYEIIDNEDKIVTRIKESSFDYKNKIILEKKVDEEFKLNSGDLNNSAGKVTSYKYIGNDLFVEVDMKKDGLLFMSDSFMPNFRVIDINNNDKILQLYKADLAFRAVPLHKGKKKLKITFESKPYMYAKYLSLLGLLIGFITIIYNIFAKKKNID